MKAASCLGRTSRSLSERRRCSQWRCGSTAASTTARPFDRLSAVARFPYRSEVGPLGGGCRPIVSGKGRNQLSERSAQVGRQPLRRGRRRTARASSLAVGLTCISCIRSMSRDCRWSRRRSQLSPDGDRSSRVRGPTRVPIQPSPVGGSRGGLAAPLLLRPGQPWLLTVLGHGGCSCPLHKSTPSDVRSE